MTRTELHKLIDGVPDVAVDAIARMAERAIEDPMVAVLDAAPWDDEPVTEEEERAVAEAKAGLARGEGIPWEEVKKQLDEADDD